MKPLILVFVAASLSGCGHFRSDGNVTGAESSAAKFNSHRSLGPRARLEVLQDSTIEQRARSHEKRGLSAAEARAAAEAEHARNGR